MKYNTATLPSGLRVIHLPSSSPVVYCGYEILAGASDEGHDEEGLAHFCEHMTFKGTGRRNALDIINCLESVGGELNAYTTKTDTVYYSAILKEHLPLAIDLLTDIVFHSTYPQREIDKEVEVICDEIESYNDSPAELIYDDFENILFDGSSLGHNILGTAKKVRSYTTTDAIRFTNRFYRADNAIFFVYGDVNFKELIQLIQSCSFPTVKSIDKAQKSHRYNLSKATRVERDMHTHQAHVMLGCRAYSIHDKRRMALYLLNNILGGPGMNARLNIALREKHGLVYTVESTMVSYTDTGMFSIYFGCDQEDIETCLQLVRNELDLFINQPLTAEEITTAKQQIKGQIGVACDNRENFALDFGKSYLHYGWEKDITTLYNHIDEVTPEQIQQVARELFPENNLTLLVYK